jgi:hypothetical protein
VTETVITPMVRVELAALCRPARQFLGVTAKVRAPQLADGWSWVAWRSEGRAWRTKWGDRPAGFLAQELYSVRLAGPWTVVDDVPAERWRAVALWSRPLVYLTKGKVSARTGRRAIATDSWGSEAWIWRAGRPGAVPMPYGIGEAQTIATTGRPAPETWAAMAAPWVEDRARELLADVGIRWLDDGEDESDDG